MMDFRVDTAKLSDEELQKVLLSEKAKKFAITHEILYADRSVISRGFESLWVQADFSPIFP